MYKIITLKIFPIYLSIFSNQAFLNTADHKKVWYDQDESNGIIHV